MVALNEPIHMTRNVVTIQSNAIMFHSYDNNCKMVGKKIKSIHYFKTVIRVQRCQAPQLLCYRVINHLQTGAYVLSFLQEKNTRCRKSGENTTEIFHETKIYEQPICCMNLPRDIMSVDRIIRYHGVNLS